MHNNQFTFGQASKDALNNTVNKLFPEFLELVEPYCKDGWLIGNGNRIYMCDFYVGSLYTDVLGNKDSYLTHEQKRQILDKAPNFEAYGKRFEQANKTWLKKRTPRAF